MGNREELIRLKTSFTLTTASQRSRRRETAEDTRIGHNGMKRGVSPQELKPGLQALAQTKAGFIPLGSAVRGPVVQIWISSQAFIAAQP
jgi:hypothetical protein